MADITSLLILLGWAVVLGSAAYLALTWASVVAHGRPSRSAPPAPHVTPATILKPLCGWEPGLEVALESFLSQQTEAPIRFVFGVASAQDEALSVARAVAERWPQHRVEFRVDARRHGANPKVDNLINMARSGLDEIVVVSDSDVVIPPGALQRLLDHIADPAVGAVTTLYRGRPFGGGTAQKLGALYLDGWFLPTAVLHARLATPQVCYGPMTAIRRKVLDGVGGLKALANSLADDTELGMLTRRQGYEIAFSPDIAETWVSDGSIRELFRHELRWAKTIRALKPVGYVALIFTHPGPIPLLLALLTNSPVAWGAVLCLMLLRWLMVQAVWRRFGRASDLRSASPLELWLREQLYFAVWISGFFGRNVVWRGREFLIREGARMEQAAPVNFAEVEPS